MNIAVLVSGGGTNLQAIMDANRNNQLGNVCISIVISSKPDAYAIKRAEIENIPVLVLSKKEISDPREYDRRMLSALDRAQTDIVVLAGFLSLLGPDVVSRYENRIINIHPSLIPAFCGPGMYGIRPHQAAIDRGVKVSGATVHFVNRNYDDGPIILQKAVCVFNEDTPESLQLRVMTECEQVILPKAIRLIAENRVIVENNKVILLAEEDAAGKERL
ncbi:MAG: phosphoribosylglycinamide formyltransferase [Clostridiaceae bacterium]|nr:phosphoribosylglycinamide formyltransferase [Clostridiaceae bacterium]